MTNLFRIQEVIAMGLIICAFDGVPIKASDVVVRAVAASLLDLKDGLVCIMI